MRNQNNKYNIGESKVNFNIIDRTFFRYKKGFLSKILNIIILMRFFISSVAGLLAFSSYYYCNQSSNLLIETGLIVFAFVSLTTSFGFVINDYFDKEKDKLSHPNRMIPSNKMSSSSVLVVAIILSFLSFLISLQLNFTIISINVSTIILLSIYSVINNKYGIWANIITALISSFVVIIGMVTSEMNPFIIYLSISIFFFIFAREILLDIRDVVSDKYIGKTSIPIIFGKSKAVVISALLFILSSIFLFVTSLISNSTLFVLLIGVLLNVVLWISFILYYTNQTSSKLERFLILTRILFIILSVSLFLN